jgi:hypothetical protein
MNGPPWSSRAACDGEREKPSRVNEDGEREKHESYKVLFEQIAVMCRTDDSQLFEETQIRVRCFSTLIGGEEVWASIFARQRAIFLWLT